MRRLEGKVAVVTGAGRGLGRAHAMALADAGASVVVVDIGRALAGGEGGAGLGGPADPSVAQGVVDEIVERGGSAVAVTADVSSLAGAAAATHAAVDAFGDLHILVNNAGTWTSTDVSTADEALLAEAVGSHVCGVLGSCREALELMKGAGHGGRIINTTAGFGTIPQSGGLALYYAMKSAVASITLSVAHEGAAHGITCNGISPFAATRQSMRYLVDECDVDPADEDLLHRLRPEQNAPLVVYLASDDAEHITGRLFDVTPDAISATAQMRISERFVVRTAGATSASWSVEDVAAAFPSIARGSDGASTWVPVNSRYPAVASGATLPRA